MEDFFNLTLNWYCNFFYFLFSCLVKTKQLGGVLNAKVTVKYHLITYTLFLAIVYFTIYFLLSIYYLLPTK